MCIRDSFKKGLSFGMGIVNAGQRAVSEEPELVVVSTPGSFRMTAQVSKALEMCIRDRNNILILNVNILSLLILRIVMVRFYLVEI